jgi:hypothetical protein
LKEEINIVMVKEKCPSCSAPLEPGAKFCWRCGAKLEPSSTQTSEKRVIEPISQTRQAQPVMQIPPSSPVEEIRKYAEEKRRKSTRYPLEEETPLGKVLRTYLDARLGEYERGMDEKFAQLEEKLNGIANLVYQALSKKPPTYNQEASIPVSAQQEHISTKISPQEIEEMKKRIEEAAREGKEEVLENIRREREETLKKYENNEKLKKLYEESFKRSEEYVEKLFKDLPEETIKHLLELMSMSE